MQTQGRVRPTAAEIVAVRLSDGRQMTVAEVRDLRGSWPELQLRLLPVILGIETAASIMGMGETKARQMVRAGTWPTRTIHNGDRWVIPTKPILDLLGVEAVAA